MVGMGGGAFFAGFASRVWLMWVTCVAAGRVGGDITPDMYRLRRFEEKSDECWASYWM
jgi:hypothetical protein